MVGVQFLVQELPPTLGLAKINQQRNNISQLLSPLLHKTPPLSPVLPPPPTGRIKCQSPEFRLWLSGLGSQHGVREDAGSIPGLARWVKDRCCCGCGIGQAATALTPRLTWDPPCARSAAVKRKKEVKSLSFCMTTQCAASPSLHSSPQSPCCSLNMTSRLQADGLCRCCPLSQGHDTIVPSDRHFFRSLFEFQLLPTIFLKLLGRMTPSSPHRSPSRSSCVHYFCSREYQPAFQ